MIKYFALGDSLTVGFGALPKLGWVSRYRFELEKHFQEHSALLEIARIGATSGEVLKMLQSASEESVRQADVITITAGGNDLIRAARAYAKRPDQKIYTQAIQSFEYNIRETISYIEHVKAKKAKPYMVRITDLYNPFPHMQDGIYWVRRFNRVLYRLENKTVRVAKIYQAFLGKEAALISFDGLHPNSRGYGVICEQVVNLGFDEL